MIKTLLILYIVLMSNTNLINLLYFVIYFQWLCPDGFRSFVALVGTNGQGIGTSPLSRWVNNCEALDLEGQDKEVLDKFIDDLYQQLDKGLFFVLKK